MSILMLPRKSLKHSLNITDNLRAVSENTKRIERGLDGSRFLHTGNYYGFAVGSVANKPTPLAHKVTKPAQKN